MGRKGTIDKPLLAYGKFWTVDTMFCVQPYPFTDVRFLHYATMTIPFFKLSTNTALPSMTQSDLNAVRLPAPPVLDQIRIANFLDRETSRIDALIGKQNQLIATLREDRTATITQAVTKGLNPDAKMKDSGIVFVGSIPAHWGVTRLDWVVDRIVDCAHSTPLAVPEGEYTVVRSGSIRDGAYRPESSFQTDRDTYLDRVRRGKPMARDIFFTREAPAGEACLVPDADNLCLGQRMVLLKPNRGRFLPELIVRAVYAQSTRAYFDVQLNGSTVGNLKMDRIAATPIPDPPIGEQRQIVEHLDRRCAAIDALIDKANTMTTVLREYRGSIIAAAITGKIDVREAV